MSTASRQPDFGIAQALLAAAGVFGSIGRIHRDPDRLGYESWFKAIRASRQELGD